MEKHNGGPTQRLGGSSGLKTWTQWQEANRRRQQTNTKRSCQVPPSPIVQRTIMPRPPPALMGKGGGQKEVPLMPRRLPIPSTAAQASTFAPACVPFLEAMATQKSWDTPCWCPMALVDTKLQSLGYSTLVQPRSETMVPTLSATFYHCCALILHLKWHFHIIWTPIEWKSLPIHTCTTGAQHGTLEERPILSRYRWQF